MCQNQINRPFTALTAGDITITYGTVTASTAGRAWMVAADADPVMCGPCAVTGWLRILDLVVT